MIHFIATIELTQVRANIAAETVVVSEDRARLLEFQLAP